MKGDINMLFKAIFHGKEHRKPYHIPSRNNGAFCLSDYSHNPKHQDSWSRDNRLYNSKRKMFAANDNINDYLLTAI